MTFAAVQTRVLAGILTKHCYILQIHAMQISMAKHSFLLQLCPCWAPQPSKVVQVSALMYVCVPNHLWTNV